MFAYLIGAVLIFAGFQAILYWYEGGLQVADKYSNPPLSQTFFHYYRPIIEARENQHPYEYWVYWRAMRKFPTLRECLKPEGQESLNLEVFNWKSMRTEAQAEVCLHHTSVELGDLDKLTSWLEAQGFKIFHSSFRGKIRVNAHWSYRRHGTYSPFSKFSGWFLGEISPFVTGGVHISFEFEPSRRPRGYPNYLQLHFEVSLI